MHNLKPEINNVILVKPIQIQEKKLDIRIAKNKRNYMYPPYGLGILNAIFKKNKIKSKILDLNFEVFDFIRKNENISADDLTSQWKKKLQNELSLFKPDLVGVSCTFTMNHENMLEIFREVKSKDDKIVTVAGGVHVSNATEMVLKASNDIDFANTYEGEKSFIEFINYINTKENFEKVSQISFLKDQDLREIKKKDPPDQDSLNVIPDYGD